MLAYNLYTRINSLYFAWLHWIPAGFIHSFGQRQGGRDDNAGGLL